MLVCPRPRLPDVAGMSHTSRRGSVRCAMISIRSGDPFGTSESANPIRMGFSDGCYHTFYKRSAMNSKWTSSRGSRLKEEVGSTEAQIAFLTERVVRLSDHLETHQKDYSSRRGLQKLLGARRRLVCYLFREDIARYGNLLSLLETRGLRVE